MGNSVPQIANPPSLRPPPRTPSPQPKNRKPQLTCDQRRDILLMYSLNHTEEYIAQYLSSRYDTRISRGARLELGLMRHVCLAFKMVGDDGLNHVEQEATLV
jgi:hypothetical protein